MEHLALNIGLSSKKYTFRSAEGVVVKKVAVRRHDGFYWEEGSGAQYPMSEEDYRIAGIHFVRELTRRDDVTSEPATWQVSIRLVVPGTYYRTHRRVTDELLERLEKDRMRDPVHIDPFLGEVAVFREAFPALSMVAVSDTAFHATVPRHESVLALPEAWCNEYNLMRFGYHGLALQSVVHQLRDKGLLVPRTVVCHLGSGSSVTALFNGESVASSMGYAPLEGVPMSTRAGDVPVGALLEILRHVSYEEVARALYHESGLLALSGYTADMEVLVHERTHRPEAQYALDVYVHRVACAVGTHAVALGGLDLVVFSGGIGERSHYVRERVAHALEFLRVHLNSQKNEHAEPLCSLEEDNSHVSILVVHPDEEAEMMRVTGTFVV